MNTLMCKLQFICKKGLGGRIQPNLASSSILTMCEKIKAFNINKKPPTEFHKLVQVVTLITLLINILNILVISTSWLHAGGF